MNSPRSASNTQIRLHASAGDRRSVGAALSTIRAARGLTQAEVAVGSGIPQGKVSRIERGLAQPTMLMVADIAEALGCSATIVFDEAEDSSGHI